MHPTVDPDERQGESTPEERRAAYLKRLRAQIAATMAANDPLAEYFTTLIQQIALEAWDAGFQTGRTAA